MNKSKVPLVVYGDDGERTIIGESVVDLETGEFVSTFNKEYGHIVSESFTPMSFSLYQREEPIEVSVVTGLQLKTLRNDIKYKKPFPELVIPETVTSDDRDIQSFIRTMAIRVNELLLEALTYGARVRYLQKTGNLDLVKELREAWLKRKSEISDLMGARSLVERAYWYGYLNLDRYEEIINLTNKREGDSTPNGNKG